MEDIKNCIQPQIASSISYAQAATVQHALQRCHIEWNIYWKSFQVGPFVNLPALGLQEVLVNKPTGSTRGLALQSLSGKEQNCMLRQWQTVKSIQAVIKVETNQTRFVNCLIIIFRFLHAHEQQFKRGFEEQSDKLLAIDISDFIRDVDTRLWTVLPRLFAGKTGPVGVSLHQRSWLVPPDTNWGSKATVGPIVEYLSSFTELKFLMKPLQLLLPQCDRRFSSAWTKPSYNNRRIRSRKAWSHPPSKSGKPWNNQITKGPGTASVFQKRHPTLNDYLPERPFNLPNASDPDVIAVQSHTTCLETNDTLSVLLIYESDFNRPIKDQDTVSLFRKINYKVCHGVGNHHSSVHQGVSTVETSTSSNLVDQEFFYESCIKYIRLFIDLGVTPASYQTIRTEGIIQLVAVLDKLRVRVSLRVVDNFDVNIFLLNILHWPIQRQHIPVETTNHTYAFPTNCQTCIILVRRSD